MPNDIRVKFSKAFDEIFRIPKVIETMAANAVTPEHLDSDATQKELRDTGKSWASLQSASA
ncbi:hypothetical protein [Variovorax sp. YR216]|uniref:hypothetical protein n=1 Tax=Variovorax sp. YR216 TaxID=1882828 RepID=UPI00089BEAC1|nr:hypothetical protein [Variovorax sp. YR216]SEB24403.1 hypothetical protein SAMN05444680_12053 [Variovorax sp. YR216]